MSTTNIDSTPLSGTEQTALAILQNMTDAQLAETKAMLGLSEPTVIGAQTIDAFAAAAAHGRDLSPTGVLAFKEGRGLTGGSAIGPDTATAYYDAIVAPSVVPPVNAATVALVEEFEGCDLAAYRDCVGVLTIGYGHTGPDVQEGMTITQDQALDLLQSDLLVARKWVKRLVTVPLTDNQYGALVSLVFNVGQGALIGTHLISYLLNEQFAAAANTFLAFDNAGGHEVEGLLRRREAERTLFLTPPEA